MTRVSNILSTTLSCLSGKSIFISSSIYDRARSSDVSRWAFPAGNFFFGTLHRRLSRASVASRNCSKLVSVVSKLNFVINVFNILLVVRPYSMNSTIRTLFFTAIIRVGSSLKFLTPVLYGTIMVFEMMLL